ncbi:MAG: acyl-CoA dehydrogenase family protein [Chakrabartia sp.]
MEFVFNEEQQMIRETAKGYFVENATSARTRRAMAADGIDRDLWTGFCQDLGLAGVTVPDVYGGAGLGQVEFALLAEAAGAQVAALPMVGLAMASQAILAGGTEAQKAAWLPKLVSGSAIAACAGSADLSAQGNCFTGTFQFVPHGASADVFVLGNDAGAWIVERSAPGVEVTTHVTMDQTRPLATVTLKSAQADQLSDGAVAMRAAREGGWICIAAEALGGAQEALDRTVGYAKERVQFGRPIGSFQAYKHRLADMMIEIEQARSAVYWAACAADEGASDLQLALHAAKAFAADTYAKCAGDMIQLHGGIGFTWEHDAHLFFKRARAIQSMFGNGNWHREQVASMILGEAA